MTIEKLSDDVQHIKDDLNKLMNSVSSQKEKEEKIIEIRNKANETKNQLEKEMATLSDEEKEKAQVLLDSLNEIINFELSLAVTQQSNNTPEVTENWNNEWEWNWEQQAEWWEQQNTTEKSWFWKQREWLTTRQWWKEHTWRNILWTLWWVWVVAWVCSLFKKRHDYESEIPWYEDMSRKEKRQARRNLRKEKREERKDRREARKDRREGRKERREARKERREERKEKSFWQRPFWKFLKWTWVWTIAYYVSHGIVTKKWSLKEAFNWKKDTDTNPVENEQNNNYENNNNSHESDSPTDNTEWDSNWDENQNDSGNDHQENSWDENDSENENVETFEAINSDSFSNAAIATLNTAKSFDTATTNKIKTTLNNYLQTNPLLKKSTDGHMVFEISDKTKFSNTIKQVWTDALSWLNMVERWLAKMIFWWKLDDINTTMRDLSTKEYKNVVFKYLWWIVKDTVKAENWTMTVKEFYDSIKECYPNKNASAIENALANSGQANVDIKDMDVEKIKNA